MPSNGILKPVCQQAGGGFMSETEDLLGLFYNSNERGSGRGSKFTGAAPTQRGVEMKSPLSFVFEAAFSRRHPRFKAVCSEQGFKYLWSRTLRSCCISTSPKLQERWEFGYP